MYSIMSCHALEVSKIKNYIAQCYIALFDSSWNELIDFIKTQKVS